MIRFDNVTKAYPDGTVAVDRLSLEAPTGKITVLVGPSGCGKTTSMRMVNRLIEPTSGTITLGGQPVSGTDATELRRKIGYVIQHAGLFPHKNVADNVMALPRLLGLGRREAGPGPWNCWNGSASARSSPTATPGSCPAASSSASVSPARWPPTRPTC